MTIDQIKQRFGIIGNTPGLIRALEISEQVALTDLSVLVTGESGVGKEIMPQIIHQLSARKHNQYIAVNCGAIPEGTIDSELFGHEKGAFTGAQSNRKGYFEVADGGTIFLDEVGELPLQTQVKLLRVLETGEFISVGSSKIKKTNVRVIAATNLNIPQAIQKNTFREDLYYRLNTLPIKLPPLRERKEDIHLLFRKFCTDFANKYRMPVLRLEPSAVEILTNYPWPGNIRQLKNIAEQASIIETDRMLSATQFQTYLPEPTSSDLFPVLSSQNNTKNLSERDLLYKIFFDLKNDVKELKKLVFTLLQDNTNISASEKSNLLDSIKKLSDTSSHSSPEQHDDNGDIVYRPTVLAPSGNTNNATVHQVEEESLSLADKEKELIIKALNKHNGKRKYASQELGISERTLYRKIKEYDIAF